MKRIVSILIILILLLTASAYTETKSASYIECDCKLGRCSCFVQLGDKGGFVKNIINLLKEQAYLP
ncbi:MAG: hypothetical protein ACSW8J_00740, partial [bacterium]